MASHDMTTGTAGASAGTTGANAHLGRLNDLDEFKVADGYPDIRGWEVKTGDGQKLGKVGDLIVDTQAMRVRYLDVELDRSVGQMARDAATPGDQEGHTLLPIGNVQLDDKHDDVLVNGYTLEQVAGLPRYGGQTITRDYERSLVDRHRNRTGVGGGVAGAAAAAGAAVSHAADKVKGAVTGDHHTAHDSYEHDDYDDQRLYAPRRQQGLAGNVGGATMGNVAGAQGEQRLTLAEEQLAVGKRQTSAGEVELRKTVETERVQEQVQLRHDEVSVERRPVTDPSMVSGEPTIHEDEIRIPVMEEQLVVQKRLVPREEIIVRRNQVVENQTVSDTVRRERVDVDDAQARAAGLVSGSTTGGVGASGMNAGLANRDAGLSGAQDRATNSGLLDRAADKLDDLKDRVDGNPASRPGPDATDRRI